MLSINTAASIDDLRLIAKRRLPRFAFDFIDGGAETETNLQENTDAFKRIKLVPKYLANASHPNLATDLFGQTYGVPFGMAPVGFLNMAWPATDLAVAELAARQNMPHVISTASSTPLEKVAEHADGNAWFQMYVSTNESIVDNLLERAWAAGITVLLVTVDVPQTGKRDRDIRNRLEIPFRITPSILTDLVTHPHWTLSSLAAGAPRLANFDPENSPTGQSRSLAEVQRLMISQKFAWDDLKAIRDKWPGKLLLKGILHPEDAMRAVEESCDGIVVSNHGGRQADYAPSSISALRAIADVVDHEVPLLLDSGVRRGADIIKAKALGASFVLAGRAFAYGAGAAGSTGVNTSFQILHSELSRAMGQLGLHAFSTIKQSLIKSDPLERQE